MRGSIVLSALCLYACMPAKSDLTLVNETDAKLTSVQIAAGGSVYYLEDIAPGETVKFEGAVSNDGSPRITWKSGGKLHAADACYYASATGDGAKGSVRFTGDTIATLSCQPE